MIKFFTLLFCIPYAAILCFAQISATNVIFTQSGTGAVTRTVSSKLDDVVSVTDFGADPTGVADSTSAIQAAINWAAGWSGSTGYMTIYFPQGEYLVTSTLTISRTRTTLQGTGNPATMINFVPTATASLFKFSDGATMLTQAP